MTEMRIKELAEKFASVLKEKLDWDELVEVGNELDLSIDELEYFGWLESDDEDDRRESDGWYEYEMSENMPCDNTGFCAGASCSNFWNCNGGK